MRVACSGAETAEIGFTIHFIFVYLDVILSVILVNLVLEVTRTAHDHILKVNFEFPVLMRVNGQNLREVLLKNGPTNSFL